MHKITAYLIAALISLAGLAAVGAVTVSSIAPANDLEPVPEQTAQSEMSKPDIPPQPQLPMDFGTGGTPLEPQVLAPPPDSSEEESSESTAESSESSEAPESSASSESSSESSALPPKKPESSLPETSSQPESSRPESSEPSKPSKPESSEPSGPPPVIDTIVTPEESSEPAPSKPEPSKPESKPESSEPSGPPIPPPKPKPESSESSVPPPKPGPPIPPPEPSTPPTPQPPPKPAGPTVRVSINGSVQNGSAYDILCQIVEAEMGGSFHSEALKAQAVAAYSYIKYENNAGRTPSLPGRAPTQKTRDAVSAVLGQALYYGGKVAFTPYHASSSGLTNSSSEVWGGSYPYLVQVSSKYDPAPRFANQKVAYEASVLQPKLEKFLGITLDSDPANWFGKISANAGGYVTNMEIFDTDGKAHTLTGRKMREQVLEYGIRSHAFTVEVSGSQIIFTTNGYGHGVGMSQTGANSYASQEGWSYAKILSHYYPGTSLS